MNRIKHFVVVMFENRSFDSLLGHLPHIRPEDGVKDKDITLNYPGGSLKIYKATDFSSPDPDPGEQWPNVNAQLWNQYSPDSNGGKAGSAAFPNFMEAPYNIPENAGTPTMDGAALDYYWNYKWQTGRKPSNEEMQSIAAVYTPETAPVINTLAQEYGVFTRWFSEVPTCTNPNREFFLTGTSQGRIDNEIIINEVFSETSKTIFDLFTEKNIPWKVYYDRPTQVIPVSISLLGGVHHIYEIAEHAATWADFIADAGTGELPAFSWLEPNMMFSPLTDYHPPTDIRAGEEFLATVYEAVRASPAWESTALIICFDEHGGTHDHVPPPAIIPPDAYQSKHPPFAFDRLGLRIPVIVVSPYTRRETVITDTFHNCSVLRSLRDRFNLGPALTRRDEIAPSIAPMFNLSEPRTDRPFLNVQSYHPDTGGNERLSQIAEYTLRNVARFVGTDPGAVPPTPEGAKSFLQMMFFDQNGKFHIPYT